jgi:4,5-dihydroxyphthalate decarboxylase
MALPLTLACWDYDRTRALSDGTIRPEGIDLTCLPLAPEETFFRMARHREFDVAEMSLSSYVLSLADPEPPFVALPVFPSRSFRHSCIFVRRGSGIERPEQLRGGRIGVPEYQITACVWIRGILAEHHGVPVDSVTYVRGGLEDPRRVEKVPLSLPPSIRVESLPEGTTLSQQLAAGELDAIYTARAPSTFRTGEVQRLFADPEAVERAYFADTGIFPIMHVVVLRRDVYERNPWIAQSLLKAFTAARDDAVQRLFETTALRVALPWVTVQAERTVALMGDDFWSYGLEPNRAVLETFLRYSSGQGLGRADLVPEDLFVPEALESFAI